MEHSLNQIAKPFSIYAWKHAATVLLMIATYVCCGSISAADDATKTDQADATVMYSGPQVGEAVKPFEGIGFKDDKLEEIKIGDNADQDVLLLCFVHRLSNDDRILYGYGLVDFFVRSHDRVESHVVLLSDDRPKFTKMMEFWNKAKFFKHSQVSLSVDGLEGPGYYGLNRNVAMTVLVVKKNEVVDNLVFNAPNYLDLEKVMVSVATALGAPKPTLKEVQGELLAERKRQREKMIRASPVFKLAPNEDLGLIMFGLVNSRGNRMKNAQRLTQQIQTWAGDDANRRAELQRYCQKILDGDFKLDPYARSAIRKMAGVKKTDAP